MANKLFVGGLPFDFTDDKLRELFEPHGTVLSAAMVPDPKHGRTRGFGFVAMSTPDESKAAIEALREVKIGEKTIWVTEAREKEKQAPSSRPPQRERFSREPRSEAFSRGPRREGFSRGPRREGFSRGPHPDGNRSFPSNDRGAFGDRPPRSFGDSPRSYFKPDGPQDRAAFRGPSRDTRPDSSTSRTGSPYTGRVSGRPGAWRGPRPTSFGDRRPRPEGSSGPSERKPFGRGPAPYSPNSRPFGNSRGPKPYGRGPSASRGPSRFSEGGRGRDAFSAPRGPKGPNPEHHKFGKFFKRPAKPSDRGDRPSGPPRRSGPRHP